MKRLLRGVIDFDNGKTPQEILSVSYNRLSHADVDWNPPSYDKIFKFVKAFFERQYELPSGETVRDHFQRLEDLETLEHLNAYLADTPMEEPTILTLGPKSVEGTVAA